MFAKADARYSTISWSISDEISSEGDAKAGSPTEFGMGHLLMHPSFNHIQVDPRTGEIIKADIRMGEGSRQHHATHRILESQLAMT